MNIVAPTVELISAFTESSLITIRHSASSSTNFIDFWYYKHTRSWGLIGITDHFYLSLWNYLFKVIFDLYELNWAKFACLPKVIIMNPPFNVKTYWWRRSNVMLPSFKIKQFDEMYLTKKRARLHIFFL